MRARSSNPHRPMDTRIPRVRHAGLTLLELILVMFLLAMVMGGGLGLFATLDFGKRQAAGLVKNAVRSAQNTAIATQSPARVRVDADAGLLTPETSVVVGTWHFEDRKLVGGGNLIGIANEELFTTDGYLGDAISFTDRVGMQRDNAFDFRDGFTIECVLRHEGVGGGRLLTISENVRLELGQGGALRGSFHVRSVKEGRSSRGGQVVVQSRPGVVLPERWTHVRLSYDRLELVLFVDGVRVAATSETAQVWDITEEMVLSDERRPFPGSLDSLVITAVHAQEPIQLPESVQIVQSPELLRFAAGGGLDRREHRDPPEIVLAFDDGSREVVGVGFYGTVE